MPPRTSPLTPGITFQDTTGRYRGAGGRFVPASAVRAALDRTLDTSSLKVQALAESLREGRIDVKTWQTQMMAEVKSVHLASAALAKGGWQQMSPADNGRAGQRIRANYQYLRGFAADVSSGKQRLDGTLPRRARLYVQAGRGTYHAVEQREQKRLGATEERSLLAAADHCDECVSEAGRDWVPVGSLVEIGARICGQNCKCSVEYR